ncbi:MAG: BrnT family toxin [Erysipelotrichaceae bacterium]|nr:BrnT family toxin [Erysipelotrichaceae bacterium]
MQFEWDPSKNDTNQKKHKVSFEEAKTVFYDEDAIMFDDPDHSDDEEERFLILGFSSKARILLVCHCFRAQDRIIRIISARKATTEEKMTYDEMKRGW